MRREYVVKHIVAEPVEVAGVAGKLGLGAADIGVWLWEVDSDGGVGDGVSAVTNINPVAGAVWGEARAAFVCFAGCVGNAHGGGLGVMWCVVDSG